MYLSGVYDGQISEINGALCCPIKCSFSYNEEKSFTEFSTVDLVDTKDFLENVLTYNPNLIIPKIKFIYFSNQFKELICLKNDDNQAILCN